MPKTVYFPEPAGPRDRSGIAVEWTKTRGVLHISGWYDTYVGIQGTEISLREFFDRLGITSRDCAKAFK
jgi:hypothetical protein